MKLRKASEVVGDMNSQGPTTFTPTPDLPGQRQQEIVDQVMRQIAIRRGSSTRRDFEVACLTLDAVFSIEGVSRDRER